MRVVLAPDGFGGTLSPAAAARAMAEGWRRGAPRDACVLAPLSDGGPGLVEVVSVLLPGARVRRERVADPLGRPVEAELLVDDGSRTAWVESAAACGLHLLADGERDPRRTSTYGVGQLLAAALDAGARRLVVGLGGSATDDGGAGMLSALGLRAVDDSGGELAPGAAALACADRLVGAPDPRLVAAEVVAATDVDAPLLGPRGATHVFAPQKGAPPDGLAALDAAKARWADVLEAHLGVEVRDRPGAGAAGGLGAALMALGATREPGLGLVAGLADLVGQVATADLVVTGEGTFDATSLTGKVVSGVAATALEAGVPCLVLAGQVRVGRREQGAAGVAGAYAVADRVGLAASLADPAGSWRRSPRPSRASGRADLPAGPCADVGWNSPATHALTRDRTAPEHLEHPMTAPDTQTPDTTTTGVVLTDPAASKVRALLEQEGRDDLALRVAVQPGGCSGLRYQLFFDERSLDGDAVQSYEGGAVKVVVDRMSVPYLAGATIDFVDTIEKQGFTIDNPNAGSSCACGDSFS